MRLERLLSTVLTISAASIAIVLIHREVRSLRGTPATSTPLPGPPALRPNWREALQVGYTIGPPNAAVQLIEFSDFECPFCKRFHEDFESVAAALPGQLSLTFVHFPLGSHRFAKPAARAAECARSSGRFAEMTRLLFRKQDSLGLKSWESFARDAGVPQLSDFSECLESAHADSAVSRGLRLGEAWGVRSTPTVLMNGWEYSIPPSAAVLARDARAVITGGTPAGRP